MAGGCPILPANYIFYQPLFPKFKFIKESALAYFELLQLIWFDLIWLTLLSVQIYWTDNEKIKQKNNFITSDVSSSSNWLFLAPLPITSPFCSSTLKGGIYVFLCGCSRAYALKKSTFPHKQGNHNMWATCMYMFVFWREFYAWLFYSLFFNISEVCMTINNGVFKCILLLIEKNPAKRTSAIADPRGLTQ